jgi:hypothetical protein
LISTGEDVTLPVGVSFDFNASLDKPVKRKHSCLERTPHRTHDDCHIIRVFYCIGESLEEVLPEQGALALAFFRKRGIWKVIVL